MTEQMLREALRDAMAVSRAPSPMSSATMVRVARRARTRRRVGWSGASCAAMAATIAVGTSVLPGLPPSTSNNLDAGGAPAAAPAFAPVAPQAEPAGPQDQGTVL